MKIYFIHTTSLIPFPLLLTLILPYTLGWVMNRPIGVSFKRNKLDILVDSLYGVLTKRGQF